MTASKPLDWVEQINATLYELEERPQFGLPTTFDLGRLQDELRALFERPSLKVSYESKGWVLPEHLWEGLGEKQIPLAIECSPLEVPAYFVTTEQDLKQLMAALFGGDESASYFYDSPIIEGFYHYFAAEMLHILGEMETISPLVPRLGDSPDSLSEATREKPCYVMNLSLSLDENVFFGRLLLVGSFRDAWKSYFSHLPPPALSEKMRRKISVDLSLEVGHVQLSFEDWKNIHIDDFIVLDHCSYDPETGKGGGLLKLYDKPIFRGRLREEGIKLTNYPIYEEVKEVVDEETLGPEEDNIYGDLDQGEDEDLLKESPEEESPPQQAPSEEKALFTPEELPVHLTVEVGHVRMTAQDLMNLAPGNLLELDVSVKEGVDLKVNGKKVGHGELIRIGETVGVRILSL